MACGCAIGLVSFGGLIGDANVANASETDGKASVVEDIAPNIDEIQLGGKIEYLTKNRPDWIEALPNMNGEKHQLTVSAGPFKNDVFCKREMKKELRKAVRKYIEHYLGSSLAPRLVSVNDREINSFLQTDHFEESLRTSVGEMRQHHARLEFDKGFQSLLDERWKKMTAWSRLLQISLAGAGLFGLLGLMYGYFRVDTATRGYYTRRLQFAATAAILALIAAGVIMAKWIPWI